MAYTAQELITRSLYLSGIVSRGLQVPSGEQIQDGLQILNGLLNFKQVETDLVPFYSYIALDCTPDTEFYDLPYVSAIETCTFNLETVRFAMQGTTRRQYYGSARVDDISSLPFNWNFERNLTGGTLALYFKPQSDYTLKMMVQLFLANVELDTDLTDISRSVPYTFINDANQGYSTSYLEYLRYALAEYLCSEYGVIFNPQSQQILKQMKRTLMYVSPPDLIMSKASVLNSSRLGGMTWAQVNIGKGWNP